MMFLKKMNLKSGLILFILIVIFFSRPIFQNKTLIPLDILKEFDLLLMEKDFLSHNYLLSDLVVQFYPNYHLIVENINKGILPFWNPYILTGTPFFADSQVAIFEFSHLWSYFLRISPLNFPLFQTVVNLFILGFSLFIYFKNLKINPLVALFGAIVLMFSGPIIVWINYPLISAFIWLPLILYCIDRIVIARDSRFLPLLAVAICFSLIAGYPQIALINLVMVGIYFWFRWWKYGVSEKKIIIAVTVFGLIGVGISTFQLGPSWDFIKGSNSYQLGRDYRGKKSFVQEAKTQINNFKWSIVDGVKKTGEYGVLAIIPKYYGSPIDRDYRPPENNIYANFSELVIYSGIATIILALSAIWWWRREKEILFWFLTSIVTFSLASDLPFLNLLKYLPFINKISLNRFRIFFVFSVVILAVYSLQQIFNRIRNYQFNLGKIVVLLLIIISFGELFYYFHDYSSTTSKNPDFILNSGAIKFLTANAKYDRVVGLGWPNRGFYTSILPNFSTILGLYDVRGYNPIVNQNFTNFAGTYLNRRGSFILADDVFSEKAIDLMSVKYLICPLGQCVNYEWVKEYSDERVDIVRNINFLPRAYIAYNISFINSDQPANELLSDKNFDIYSEVFLNDFNKRGVVGEKNVSLPIEKAEIIKYSLNQVVVKSKTNKEGILVLTDSYDGGWRVKINNHQEQVLLVNGIFRGVFVSAGENEIVFSYLPKYFYVYLSITIISLFFLIFWSYFIVIKKHKYF